MENENKDFTEQEITDENAKVIAEQFKAEREHSPELKAAFQKFYDDLVAFNPDGEEKPL